MNPINLMPGDARCSESHCTPLPEAFSDAPADTQGNTFQGQPLALRHVRQLANAEAFAASQGTPLTAHVTIHLRLAAGFTTETWAKFQSSLFDRMARWLMRRGIPVAYAYTRECGARKGPHVHLLLHLPHAHWGGFKRFLLFAGHFQTHDEGGEAIVVSGGKFGMLVETMRAGALRYVLKSLEASPSTLAVLGLRPQSTRPVLLKRCGVSHTIAQLARKEAGWLELRSFQELHAHLHPAANDNGNAVEASHAAA